MPAIGPAAKQVQVGSDVPFVEEADEEVGNGRGAAALVTKAGIEQSVRRLRAGLVRKCRNQRRGDHKICTLGLGVRYSDLQFGGVRDNSKLFAWDGAALKLVAGLLCVH